MVRGHTDCVGRNLARHDYALLAGGLAGSMAVSFVGFIGPPTIDLWFKVAVDLAALGWLAWLGRQVLRRS